jgi:C-terminal processing protease CtpA/Prc
MLEAALAFNAEQTQAGTSNGIILDVRGNGGGWDLLYMTMASYCFTPDSPELHNVFDNYQYDDSSGDLVKKLYPDYQYSYPDPALAYTGPLVVLIDQVCESSSELFVQPLQGLGRAELYGQFTSEGAGGTVDRIQMPGGILFQYTVGRSYYAGTCRSRWRRCNRC